MVHAYLLIYPITNATTVPPNAVTPPTTAGILGATTVVPNACRELNTPAVRGPYIMD